MNEQELKQMRKKIDGLLCNMFCNTCLPRKKTPDCQRLKEIKAALAAEGVVIVDNEAGGELVHDEAYWRVYPLTASDPAKSSDDDRSYPCAVCGTMRSAHEGGTTFTLYDDCWDKYHKAEPAKKERSETYRPGENQPKADDRITRYENRKVPEPAPQMICPEASNCKLIIKFCDHKEQHKSGVGCLRKCTREAGIYGAGPCIPA